jgi:hypothetical protein
VLHTITAALADLLRPVTGAAADDDARMIYGALKAMMHARIERGEPLVPGAHRVASVFLRGLGR